MDGFVLFMAIGLGLLVGFGASFYMFSTILDKSNNIGDTTCHFDDYCPHDIHYDRNRDEVLLANKDQFLAEFGGDPSERKTYATDRLVDDNEIPDELPPVDKPLFKPLG